MVGDTSHYDWSLLLLVYSYFCIDIVTCPRRLAKAHVYKMYFVIMNLYCSIL